METETRTEAEVAWTKQKLASPGRILIVSGEGDNGTVVEYTGARTMRAIRARLTRERCNGDRWARADIYSHESMGGDVYVDIDSGEYHEYARS